jgi:hypothetical protein
MFEARVEAQVIAEVGFQQAQESRDAVGAMPVDGLGDQTLVAVTLPGGLWFAVDKFRRAPQIVGIHSDFLRRRGFAEVLLSPGVAAGLNETGAGVATRRLFVLVNAMRPSRRANLGCDLRFEGITLALCLG